MKQIYYLEDDWYYAAEIPLRLQRLALERGDRWVIEAVANEQEFNSLLLRVKNGEKPFPSLFLIDIMVSVAPLGEDEEAGDETQAPYDRTGLRCASRAAELFDEVPLVAFSIVDEDDAGKEIEDSGLKDRLVFVPKGRDIQQERRGHYHTGL